MAEKGNGEDPKVNLELPSLGFGGRRKRRKEQAAARSGQPESPAAEETTESYDAAPPAESVTETRPLYVDDVPPPVPATGETPVEREVAVATAEPAAAEKPPKTRKAPKPAKPPKPAKAKRADRPPIITGLPAAMVTGGLIGLITVGLTVLGLRGCEAVNDTESCGAAGFFIWVAILIAMVVLGGWLLRFFRVLDPGSTSFLAVGLTIVIVLLFLIDVVFEWWMVIVVPVIFVATYALSHWVTVRFIEPANDGRVGAGLRRDPAE